MGINDALMCIHELRYKNLLNSMVYYNIYRGVFSILVLINWHIIWQHLFHIIFRKVLPLGTYFEDDNYEYNNTAETDNYTVKTYILIILLKGVFWKHVGNLIAEHYLSVLFCKIYFIIKIEQNPLYHYCHLKFNFWS